MRRAQRIVAGMSSVVLASTVGMTIVPSAVGAASGPNMGFCEPFSKINNKMALIGMIAGFANMDFGDDTSSSSVAENDITPEMGAAMLQLLFAPSLASDYKTVAKNAPGGDFKKALNELAKFYASSEGVLKKNGLSSDDIKQLRKLDLTELDSDSSAEDLAPEDLSDEQVFALATAAKEWVAKGDETFAAYSDDEKLNATADKAMGDCDPLDNKGARVEDACKLLKKTSIAKTVDGDIAEAESDDSQILMRNCTVDGDKGSINLSVTTPSVLNGSFQNMEGATNVSGIGKKARITQGTGTGSLMDFSFSSSGKTIWVFASKTAFTLSLDKRDANSGESVDVTDKELIAAAKTVAKALKI